MKLAPALEHLHSTMAGLTDDLRTTAERHATEHDVYHVGLMLSQRYEHLADRLSSFVQSYGERVVDTDVPESLRAFAGRMRRATADLLGRSEKAGLVLLRDLRELYVEAEEAEIDWTIVRQGALAARDRDLADLAAEGISETERIVRWLKTRVKETAPQVLVT
jgi:hypothetical protein